MTRYVSNNALDRDRVDKGVDEGGLTKPKQIEQGFGVSKFAQKGIKLDQAKTNCKFIPNKHFIVGIFFLNLEKQLVVSWFFADKRQVRYYGKLHTTTIRIKMMAESKVLQKQHA